MEVGGLQVGREAEPPRLGKKKNCREISNSLAAGSESGRRGGPCGRGVGGQRSPGALEGLCSSLSVP